MKKSTLTDPTKIVDVVMYKTAEYSKALELKKYGEKKGWQVKIGQEGYLKQGNKL